MLSSSGEVYFDASAVSSATQAEKHEMLGSIVSGILGNDTAAGNTAYSLGLEVTDFNNRYGSLPFPRRDDGDTYYGALNPVFSLGLVKDLPRLHGFINAIKRWDEQE